MTDKITIYGTGTCPFCNQARAAYGDKAIFIDIDESPQKLDEMLTFSKGEMRVPVIIEGDRVTIGFAGEVSLRGGIPLTGGT